MKVISVKEPFASLIASGKKTIETRSFKTNYRGELFIHASGKGIAKEFMNGFVEKLIENIDMNYGNIICRCNLVDCILMDEEFISSVKQNLVEYNCGEYKVGRYAWILKDVEPIYPIFAKGKLNIWNFDGEYELIKTSGSEGL